MNLGSGNRSVCYVCYRTRFGYNAKMEGYRLDFSECPDCGESEIYFYDIYKFRVVG